MIDATIDAPERDASPDAPDTEVDGAADTRDADASRDADDARDSEVNTEASCDDWTGRAPGVPTCRSLGAADRGTCSMDGPPSCLDEDIPGVWDVCHCGCSEWGRWTCTGSGSTPTFVCPRCPPSGGSACPTQADGACNYYPGFYCQCPAVEGDRRWRCSPEIPRACQTADHTGVTEAAGLTLTRSVASLTGPEAAAWCRWVLRRGGLPEGYDPEVLPEGAPGFASSRYAHGSCGGPLRASWQVLPVELCVANLLREPHCESTLQALSDCAATLLNHCIRVGLGCAAHRASPNCASTYAIPFGSGVTPIR